MSNMSKEHIKLYNHICKIFKSNNLADKSKVNKNLQKYMELDKNFFSTSTHWTYTWKNKNGIDECIDWDDKKNRYVYYQHSTNKTFYFKDVYSVLDGIKINEKSLRELLLNTDFNIDSIN